MVIKVKLNNKGFAISTIVYGLAVMGMLLIAMIMATLSNNRTNSYQLSKSIEEELNRISKRSATFEPIEVSRDGTTMPEAQEYRVPYGQAGWYRIELWGTQGGGSGGYGAYTSGITYLEEGTALFFYVGSHKSSSASGRETDVRLSRGAYNDEDSLATRIMVAAGGGAGSKASGGTLTGGSGRSYAPGGILNTDDYTLSGALNGYLSENITGTFVQPSVGTTITSFLGNNNGGDGYYPSSNQNYGGISYIAGYAGSRFIKNKRVTNQSIYEFQETIYHEENNTYTSTGEIERHYFIDGRMIEGVNKGDGQAKIERIIEKNDGSILDKKNKKFDGVYTVRDCNDNGTASLMIVMTNGEMKTINPTEVSESTKCKDFVLPTVTNIDELAIWHGTSGVGLGKNLENNTIAVCKNINCSPSEWLYLKKATNRTKYSETETITGTRISAYQFDSTENIPDTGTYYIQPVLSDTKVMTVESNEVSSKKARIEYLKGLRRQMWSIERITDSRINPNLATTNEYIITDIANYKSLSLSDGENKAYGTVLSRDNFNNTTRTPSQIWKIIPLGNGTYTIESSTPRQNASVPSGALVGVTDSWGEASLRNHIIVGKATISSGIEMVDGLRFKLIKLDY